MKKLQERNKKKNYFKSNQTMLPAFIIAPKVKKISK
jgi:hypothetical protein